MSEFLSKFNGGELIGLVAVLGAFACGTLAIVMGIWHATRTAEIAASLKKAMLDKGMSAEEIRTVLEAGTIHSRGGCKSRMRDEIRHDRREPSPESYRASR